MILYRYMIGDVVAGGCVVALSKKDAHTKVKAYYEEYSTWHENNTGLKDEEITVWLDGEGFIDEHPHVVEVYP